MAGFGDRGRETDCLLSEVGVDAIRALVAGGRVESVSGFVQHAVQVTLDDAVGWGAMLAEAAPCHRW